MAQPIYKVYMARPTEAWYQLSEEERGGLLRKLLEAFERVGGKEVVRCDSAWASEQWPFFGLEEYPDIAAEQAHSRFLQELGWHRYLEGMTLLGTRAEPLQ